MSLNVHQLLKNIRDNKDSEVYLPQYMNQSLSAYYKYSLVDLTMKYVMLYEVISEKHNKQTEQVKDVLEQVNQLVKDTMLCVFDESTREAKVEEIDSVRKEIMSRMKSITAYADIMQLYEYVLNRIEDKFVDEVEEFNTETFVQEIISYIFANNDNVVINTKVQEIIGQLPVRMTKSKYFELLANSISIYKGNERSAVDGYLYMIKSAATLERPKEMKKQFPDFYKAITTIESADFKNLTKPEFYRLNGMVQDRALELVDISDLYMQLQEIVNCLYAYNIAVGYQNADLKEEALCKELIGYVNEQFLNGAQNELSNEQMDKLTKLEGTMESSMHEINMLEGGYEDVMTMYGKKLKGLMLDAQAACVTTCMKLLGNSLFIDLNAKVSTKVADDAYIEKVTSTIIKNLTKMFDKVPQSVVRAVMASSLNKMPVFFNNSDEIVEYVTNSMNQCKDVAEKNACYSIIKDIMEEV
ncbi:hypothetical protein [Anaerosporobacter faecicola]|uniref:hypothetical protein n=1 Tax=Anaerosporobacter faecicola TaxID=2718714 RepID=UPI001438A8BC|nr:hypothetical protein [Anaerosporobacter faecicola]